MPLPIQFFSTFDDLETYINTFIIPNAMELIQGDEHNAVENGLLVFNRQSPLNWETAKVESGGGNINASRPVSVFISAVPTTLSWSDNIYHQYIFINTTLGDIPLGAGNTYFDVSLTSIDKVPARSIVNIVKASNNLWIVASVPSSGSLASLPPLKGVVDRGFPNDPVSGTSLYQNDNLIGLGSTNNGDIDIMYGQQVRSNYGINTSFIYDSVLGTIDLDYNASAEEWFTGASLSVDRNQ